MKILGDIIIAVLALIFIFMLYKFLTTPKEDAEKRENAKTNLTIAGFALTAFTVVFGGLNFLAWLFTTSNTQNVRGQLMDILLFLPGVLLLFVLLPAIVLAALWDFAAFIIFLATLRSHEEKHKKAEKMFVISSAVLTVGTAAAAVCYLLIMLIDNFIW